MLRVVCEVFRFDVDKDRAHQDEHTEDAPAELSLHPTRPPPLRERPKNWDNFSRSDVNFFSLLKSTFPVLRSKTIRSFAQDFVLTMYFPLVDSFTVVCCLGMWVERLFDQHHTRRSLFLSKVEAESDGMVRRIFDQVTSTETSQGTSRSAEENDGEDLGMGRRRRRPQLKRLSPGGTRHHLNTQPAITRRFFSTSARFNRSFLLLSNDRFGGWGP